MADPFFNVQAPIWGRAAFMAAALAPNLLIGPLSQTPEARAPLMAPRIVPARIQQSWTQNLLVSTLAPTFQQRAPLQAPRRPVVRAAEFRPPNLLQSTLGSTTAPFRSPDSGLPKGWAVDRSVSGFGATIYLTDNAPPLSRYDWPLPVRAPRLEQTWTQNLLQSTLTPLVYEWRSPLQAPRPAAVRAILTDAPNLLVSTLAPTGVAPFVSKDWSLPRTSPVPTRGEAQGIPLAIFAGIQGKPFGACDALIRSAPRLEQSWSCNLLLTTLSGIQQTPFSQRDWQVPRTAPRLDQTTTQSLLSSTLGAVTAPFVSADSSLSVRSVWFDRGWTQNLVLTTLSQPIGARSPDVPQRQPPLAIGWSQNLLASTLAPNLLPVGAPSPQIQRAVLRSSIGEGQSIPLAIFAGIQGKPFPNQDWPLPIRAPRLEQTSTQGQPFGSLTFFYPPRVIVYPDANRTVYPDADRIVYVGGPRILY